MDATYFLKSRTRFIRFFHMEGVKPFLGTKHAIENGLPPFDNPPYSEDPEPPFLEEWSAADSAIKLLNSACLSLLSDTLKLYFQALERHVIGFSFSDRGTAFKKGFVPAYLDVLGEILQTDWSDCPADRALLEQIVLARNVSQHGSTLHSFDVSYDKGTLHKHPQPFFMSEQERRDWIERGGSADSLFSPSMEVTERALVIAIEQVEMLADWIDGRMHHAYEWRMRCRD